MQRGALKGNMWRAVLAATLLVALAQGKANAQRNSWEQGGVRATDARVAPASDGYLLSDIERRLASLEAANHLADDDLGNVEECVEVEIQTKPSHKFRGRMFFDQIWMDDLPAVGGVPAQPLENQTGFDTLRIGVQGNIYENLKYSVELEYEGEEVDYKDVYAELTNLPYLGHFRIGHFKEPSGLEWLTSSRYVTFMERATPTEAFTGGRNVGIMLYDYWLGNENWSWYAGLFRGSHADNDEDVDADSNDWAGTFRFAGTPYYDEHNGRCLLHCGLWGSARRTGEFGGSGGNGDWEGTLELDSRDSFINITLGNPALGNPRSSSEFGVFGTELAYMHGPAFIQTEFMYASTGDAAGINAWGTYVEAGYFLTGENRGYNRSSKAWDRVHPYEPFFWVDTCEGGQAGLGAWEIAARWSWTDLESIPALVTTGVNTVAPTVIGTQENIAIGVNWYLNPYSRMMFNYIHTISDYTFLGKAEGDHFGLRFQIDW